MQYSAHKICLVGTVPVSNRDAIQKLQALLLRAILCVISYAEILCNVTDVGTLRIVEGSDTAAIECLDGVLQACFDDEA